MHSSTRHLLLLSIAVEPLGDRVLLGLGGGGGAERGSGCEEEERAEEEARLEQELLAAEAKEAGEELRKLMKDTNRQDKEKLEVSPACPRACLRPACLS